MPDFKFELAPDTPLFSDEDPLTVSIPDADRKMHTFRCRDRAGLKQIDPSDKQVTWFVAELTHNVVDEQQDEFHAMLVEGLESGLIPEVQPDGTNTLAELLKGVRDEREKRERGEISRSVRRPTGAAKRRSS
jgi:hypothetical protein